jgi:hypothetical protein
MEWRSLARNGMALDSASKAYVKQSVVAITTNWNTNELWKRASPHLLQIATRRKVARLFAAAKYRLGALRDYRGSKGQALMSVVNAHIRVSAQYIVNASFQRGDARLRVSVVKQDGRWMIEGFYIGAPTLTPRTPASQADAISAAPELSARNVPASPRPHETAA